MENLPQDLGFLTVLLKALIQSFTLGHASIVSELMGLLTLLTTLEVLIAGLWYLHSRDIDLGNLAIKLMGITVLGWIITEWPRLTRMVVKTFVHFGLSASGGAFTETDFSDPSNILWYGMSVAVVVTTHLGQYTGPEALYHIGEVLLLLPIGALVMILYFALAVWVFVIQVEFYACAAFSVALLPFGAFRLTTFLAEKTFAWLASSAIQVMALAFIMGSILPVMVRLQGGMHPTLTDIALQLGGAITLVVMAWRVNKFAGAITQGSPQLTIHDVTKSAKTAGTTAMTYGASAASSAAGAVSTLTRRRA